MLGPFFLATMAASIPTTAQSFESASNRGAPLWLSGANNSMRRRPHSQVNASYLAYDALDLDLLLQLSHEETIRKVQLHTLGHIFVVGSRHGCRVLVTH